MNMPDFYKEERQTLNEQLESILEESKIPHRDSESEESFNECVLCKEWDGHEPACPIPAIEKWLAK